MARGLTSLLVEKNLTSQTLWVDWTAVNFEPWGWSIRFLVGGGEGLGKFLGHEILTFTSCIVFLVGNSLCQLCKFFNIKNRTSPVENTCSTFFPIYSSPSLHNFFQQFLQCRNVLWKLPNPHPPLKKIIVYKSVREEKYNSTHSGRDRKWFSLSSRTLSFDNL